MSVDPRDLRIQNVEGIATSAAQCEASPAMSSWVPGTFSS